MTNTQKKALVALHDKSVCDIYSDAMADKDFGYNVTSILLNKNNREESISEVIDAVEEFEYDCIIMEANAIGIRRIAPMRCF